MTPRRKRYGSVTVRTAICLAAIALAVPAGAQTCRAPGDGDWNAWLQAQENAGGHTLKCHTNKTVNGLISRMEARGGPAVDACNNYGASASTWSGSNGDRKALIKAMKVMVADLPADLLDHNPGNQVASGNVGSKIGLVVEQHTEGKNRHACPGNDGYSCFDAKKWQAVVRVTAAADCYLLTAYPIR